MNQKKQRLCIVLLAFFVLVGSFSGCSTVETPVESGVMTEQKPDLWIVLDGCDRFVTDLVSSLAEDFLQTHEGLIMKVESLTNTEEREIRLEQLRLQIMAGKGPDVYILSPNRILDPLFSDIAMATKKDFYHLLKPLITYYRLKFRTFFEIKFL